MCIASLLVTAPLAFAQAPAYRAPRTIDGQSDLQGVWQAVNTAVLNIQDHPAELGVPAGQGIVEGNEIPYLPLALPQRQIHYRNRLTADPERKCFMVGTPRVNYMPYPFEIVQTPNQITILYEYVHTSRHVRLRQPASRGRDPVVHGRFARAGTGRRWWRTSPISPIRTGSIGRGTITAPTCTLSNAGRGPRAWLHTLATALPPVPIQ